MRYLFRKVKYAFMVWPSILGYLVSLCLFYAPLYIANYFHAGILPTTRDVHQLPPIAYLIEGFILFISAIIGILFPIQGGLGICYTLAGISIVSSFWSHSYVGIFSWLLLMTFATISVFRTTPPYYRNRKLEEEDAIEQNQAIDDNEKRKQEEMQ